MVLIRYTVQGFEINHNGRKTTMNELLLLLIKASDLRDAIEIAKNCPIFDYDGIVEVREVQQLQV